jgi:uncharacterized membrane-anchored protein
VRRTELLLAVVRPYDSPLNQVVEEPSKLVEVPLVMHNTLISQLLLEVAVLMIEERSVELAQPGADGRKTVRLIERSDAAMSEAKPVKQRIEEQSWNDFAH